ncbi:hypothetical protein BLOT_008471 [Blomia tropicalis]|nr:hypothetical protein BLOT_008471 [Blomia tropicalis]
MGNKTLYKKAQPFEDDRTIHGSRQTTTICRASNSSDSSVICRASNSSDSSVICRASNSSDSSVICRASNSSDSSVICRASNNSDSSDIRFDNSTIYSLKIARREAQTKRRAKETLEKKAYNN